MARTYEFCQWRIRLGQNGENNLEFPLGPLILLHFLKENSTKGYGMKTLLVLLTLTPSLAFGFCAAPTITRDGALQQMLQSQYQQCLEQERHQQKQEQMQRRQLELQKEQLRVQQQQMKK